MAVIDRWFAHPIGETALLVLCVGPGMLLLGWAERRRERNVEKRKALSVEGARAVRATVTSGDLMQFRKHIKQLPNLNERLAPESWTLLHFLAAQGEQTKPVHAVIADDLLKAGADVNCRTELGWTPIHMIAMGGERQASELARILIAHGADLTAVDRMGADWRAHWQHGNEIRTILEEAPSLGKIRRGQSWPSHRRGRSAMKMAPRIF